MDVKILVIGAGVNGSIVAAKLRNADVNVTVLARGQRYAALRDQGIIIEDPLKHQRSQTKVPVIEALAPDDVYDYVLVVVRRNQVADLLPVLASNQSPNIVFMHNNPSGPAEYAVIGKERVMIGFVFGGGYRDGDVVRAVSGVGGALGAVFGGVPFGEMDGTITPRLTRLVQTFHRAGLDARVSTRVPDYLATHAALVALLTCLDIKYGGDLHAPARSTADLELAVDALREMLQVVTALGYRVTPPRFAAIKFIPRFVLVAALRAVIQSELMDVSAADVKMPQARTEMLHLIKEFEARVDQSGLTVPATRKLLARLGMKVSDFELVELNEAFASQALVCLRQLGIADDAEFVNPNGGAIAFGHPLGMSGARLAADVALELQPRNARYGLATMCVGVGQGVALALEGF